MLFVRIRAIAAGVMAAVFVTGCGGSSPQSPLPFSPSTASAPSGQRGRHARMTVRLRIPKRKQRRSHFVSPSTKSIVVKQGANALGTFETTANSGGCQQNDGAIACVFTVGVSPGNDQTFTVDAYDALKGGGKLLSSGSVTQNVVAGKDNFLLLTLSGAVASVTIGLQNPNPPAGTPANVPVTVMAKDADGNIIVGPGNYQPAIKLTDSDSTGITKLSTSNVTGPGTSVTLAYNGKSIVSASVGASVTGLPPGKITKGVFAPVPTVIADYALPLGTGSVSVEPTAIATGPDGNIWVAVCCNAASGIVKMSTSGAMTYYASNTTPSMNLPQETFGGLVAGPDGNVWYAGEGGDIGYITPAGTVTNFPLTGGTICSGASAWRAVRSKDGGFWFTFGCGSGGTQLAHVKTDGTIAPFDIAGFNYVNGLVLGKDGNLYVAGEMASNDDGAIAKAVVSGATISSSSLFDVTAQTNVTLDGIFQTPDGDLWVDNDACSPSILTRVHPNATFSASTATSYNSLAACAYLAYGVTLPDGTLWIADGEYPILTRVTPAAYPAAPKLWDFAAPSSVVGYEWDVTIGPDGDLYVADYDKDTGVSGDVVKIAY